VVKKPVPRKLQQITTIVAALSALHLTALQAEEGAPLFPLPFTLDFTRGSGWGIAIGAGVEYETAYAGSDEVEFEVDPALAIQWRQRFLKTVPLPVKTLPWKWNWLYSTTSEHLPLCLVHLHFPWVHWTLFFIESVSGSGYGRRPNPSPSSP
jgi:hypothetical protein